MQEVIYNLSINAEFSYLKHVKTNSYPVDGPAPNPVEMENLHSHPAFQLHLERKAFKIPSNSLLPGYEEGESKYYSLISYNRDKMRVLTDDNKKYRLFRSVIVNPFSHHVVSFSTPKAIPVDLFTSLYPPNATPYPIAVEEIVEGTMINLFWDAYYRDWEISTRQQIGARTKFGSMTVQEKDQYSWTHYSSSARIPSNVTFDKTFRQMFFETLKESNIDLDMFDTKYTYTFVMQHVENRLVLRCEECRLYLVDIFLIYNSPTDIEASARNPGYEISLVQPISLSAFRSQNPHLEGRLWYPRLYTTSGANHYTSYIHYYQDGRADFRDPGVMIRNRFTNDRTKVANPNYERIKDLRGNQPKPLYRYLELRRETRISDYCHYFPEYQRLFLSYESLLTEFGDTLYKEYKHVYISKSKPFEEVQESHVPHLRKLHRKYRRELAGKGLSITPSVVQQYVSSLTVSKQGKILTTELSQPVENAHESTDL